MDEIKTKVRNFLSRFFRRRELGDDEDFLSLGFVNSLFSMQLIMFIEKEFNIRLDNKDLHLNNFKSINAIAALVESKLSFEGSLQKG